MTEYILSESKEFIDKAENLLIDILGNLKETLNIISQVDSKKQNQLETHILSYYKKVQELSSVLNQRIDVMHDEMEFQVNATIERLMLDNKLNSPTMSELDSNIETKKDLIKLIRE